MSPKHEARLPLAFIPPGEEVRLAALGDGIDPAQRNAVAGQQPGQRIQHQPR